MSLKISSALLKNYFQPWPLAVPKGGEWSIYFYPFEGALKIKSCWKHRGRCWPIGIYAKWIEEQDWSGKRHQIRSMCRATTWVERPRIIVIDGKIWDGSHSMCAWWLRRERGFPEMPTHVMVIERVK